MKSSFLDFPRARLIGSLAVACIALMSCDVPAQEETAERGAEYPLQILHVTGVDRLTAKIDALMAAADRPELTDVMHTWLETTLRNLGGVDRTRPLGMMFYIKPGLTPGISAVSYLPVSNKDDFLKFLAGESGTFQESKEVVGQFEVRETGWGPDLAVRFSGGYAFTVDLEEAIDLDRKFPSPERLASKLNSRYDVAYSLLLRNIPSATRTLFLEFFKNQALAGLQQRDGEPDAAYSVRRSNGESLIDLLDMVVNQGEELTIGAFSNLETENGFLEFEIQGAKDSGLARFCRDLAGRRSYFEPVINQAATFSINTSLQLDEKRRKPFISLFGSATEIVAAGLKEKGKPESAADPIRGFFQSLRSTAEAGHLDLFAQLSGTEPFDYRFLGGLRVLPAGNFPEQLADLLKFAKATIPEMAGENAGQLLGGLKLSDRRIGDYPVHSLALPTPPDEMGQSLFGEAPNLYLHATPQALWFAMGQESALEQLEQEIKAVTAPPETAAAPKRANAPIFLSTHASHWVEVGLAAGFDPEKNKAMSMSGASFTPENDEAQLTGRPTDTGGRIRIEFQPGYFSWFGRLVAMQMDMDLTRAERREQRKRQQEQGQKPGVTPPATKP